MPILVQTPHTSFELYNHETLLEALLRTGHAAEYQCCGGYCGACRLKLISGTISYREIPMAFLMPDEILPCCCIVRSNIHIICPLRQCIK